MADDKYITMRFKVLMSDDEDYDENDAPIGITFVDGIDLETIDTDLSEKDVRELGNFIQHSSYGQYYVNEFIPAFLRGENPVL